MTDTPQREDDAAFLHRMDADGCTLNSDFERVMALARREPTRLEGGVTQELRKALDQLSEAAEQWAAHGGAEAHRVLSHIHPSFNAVYEAYKPLRDALEAAANAAPSDAGGKEGRARVDDDA